LRRGIKSYDERAISALSTGGKQYKESFAALQTLYVPLGTTA